jgi:hypothetical protein
MLYEMRERIQQLRLDSHNPNGKREAHFRVGKLPNDPFVVGDVFIDSVRECLHRGDKDPDIDEAEGVRDLEFENVSVPTGHVPELNLYLYAAFFEVRADVCHLVSRNKGFGFPSSFNEKSVNPFIESELVGREDHDFAASFASLWRIKLRDVVNRSKNVDDILFQIAESLAVENFRSEAVRI